MNQRIIICLSRVSTDLQDLEQHQNALRKYAESQQYAPEDIIFVSNHESGNSAKKDQATLEGIIQTKQFVEKGVVKEIVVSEISRISRNPTFLYEFRDYCREHRVQLTILNPFIKCFDENEDFKCSLTSNLVFATFATFAESELEEKKWRTQRGRLHKQSQNLYCGGSLLYGYQAMPDGTIVINEEEANIVRKVFKMYNERALSILSIANHLWVSHATKHTKKNSMQTFVSHILHQPAYAGIFVAENYVGVGYKYPSIITEEDYKKAEERLANNKRFVRKNSENIYFCQGILVNEEGFGLCPCRQMNIYKYNMYGHKDKTISIHINSIDSFAWQIAKPYYLAQNNVDKTELVADITEQMRMNFLEQQGLVTKNIELNKQIDKAQTRILEGKLDERNGDAFINQKKMEIQHNKFLIKAYDYTLASLAEKKKGVVLGKSEDADNLTDEHKRDAIRSVISRIVIFRPESSPDVKHTWKRVLVEFNSGKKETYYLWINSKGKHLFDKNKHRLKFDYVERFPNQKKKYTKKKKEAE